jgi:hypothetical protein
MRAKSEGFASLFRPKVEILYRRLNFLKHVPLILRRYCHEC